MADPVAEPVVTEEVPASAFSPEVLANVPDKFKNADGTVNTSALLNSYQELEKLKSKPKTPEGTEEPVEEPVTEEEEESEGDEVQEATDLLAGFGLKMADLTAEYEQGGLSEETYAALAEKGFSKVLVDNYISGIEAQNANLTADLTSREMAVVDAVGGQESFSELLEWAGTQPAYVYAAYNRALVSKDTDAARDAVQVMAAMRQASEGTPPARRVEGAGGGTRAVSGFRSRAEQGAAMSDPRYSKDPAYRADVERKSMLSDF